MKETKKGTPMLKITRPSYVVAETSKEQKAVLNILTDNERIIIQQKLFVVLLETP